MGFKRPEVRIFSPRPETDVMMHDVCFAIQKNGGVLENEVEDGGKVVQRYWIDVRRPED